MPFGGVHTRRESLALIGSAVLLSACPRTAASAAARRWSVAGDRVEKLDAIDVIMRSFMQERAIRAGAVAVARQGDVLFERAYTWAEPDYPVTGTKSPFRLASVSKAFTEALVYTLVQADAVKLETAVFPYSGSSGQRCRASRSMRACAPSPSANSSIIAAAGIARSPASIRASGCA